MTLFKDGLREKTPDGLGEGHVDGLTVYFTAIVIKWKLV